MTVISNIASPGAPTHVVAESPVRQPLAGDIAWSTPTLAVPIGADAQIQRVPNAVVDRVGNPLNRR